MYDLRKAKERAHILEGLKVAVENIDEIVALIKKSSGPAEAKEKLGQRFSLSEIQSQAILDMRLQKLTGLERDKIIKDYNDVLALIEDLEAILDSPERVNQIIRDGFVEIKEKFGDERKTQIIEDQDEIQIEDLIKSEEQIVTITHKGYVKRMAIDTYRTQKEVAQV